VLTLSFAIGNLIYSKVCFDKAIDCFTKTELENGIKYLDKSKNTWLNLNEYDQLDRLYLDGAKKCIRSNYKKAFDFFNMIEDNTIYISEIKDLYINEIDNSKDWNNNTIELFKDMERILNKNGQDFEYRDRTDEILFMDLRQKGHPYEKKYTEFTKDDIYNFSKTYHDWQSKSYKNLYKDIKSYCKSVKKEELDDYSLIPSKYIEFDTREEKINYEEEMIKVQNQLKELYAEESQSKEKIKKFLQEIGYGI